MRIRLIPPLLAVLIALGGCAHSISSGTTADSSGTPAAPTFGQFTDVPIPDGARMDAERSLLVGPGESWVGRLVFSVRWSNAPELFDFYKAQMPTYKWQEISSVRADISVMTWQRADRIATIQIEETTLGAAVTLTMGPVNSANPAATNQPPAPSAAPAPTVTEQPLK